MKQPKIYNTALYMRLSRDDESFGDSVSIETQRTILRKYAADNGLHIADEYVDDGWSGTNFERPSFKRMMADVDAGKVNCIVTEVERREGRIDILVCNAGFGISGAAEYTSPEDAHAQLELNLYGADRAARAVSCARREAGASCA